MAKELKDVLKRDLIAMVTKLEKKVKTLEAKPNTKEVSGLKKKIAELKEVNRLLAIQQDDEIAMDVNVPVTTPQPKQKKLTEMDEFELSRHISIMTSKKQL